MPFHLHQLCAIYGTNKWRHLVLMGKRNDFYALFMLITFNCDESVSLDMHVTVIQMISIILLIFRALFFRQATMKTKSLINFRPALGKIN